MTTIADIATPELDRQKELIDSGKAPMIQDFLEWLPSKGFVLARRCDESIHDEDDPDYCRTCADTGLIQSWIDYPRLMADFFEIDLNTIEKERRAILNALRGDRLDDVRY